MKKGSLKSKFVWLAALVILIPLAVTNTVAVRLYRQLVNSSLQNLNYNNIVHVGITTENYIYNSNELATYIIANNHIRQFLLSDPTDPHYAERISDAAAILSSFPVSSRFISKATVFSNSGVSINNNNYSSLTITEQQKEQALKLNGHLFWILEKNKNNEDTLVLCRSIRDTRHLSRQIGFLKVSLNMETLRDLLTPPKDLEEISYHIIGADGKTMLSTSPDILETLPTGQELYGFAAQSLGGCRQEDSVFFSAYPIEKTDWILLSVSTDKGTKHFVTTMGISLTFSTLICIIVCLLIAIFFGNIVTKPLKQVGDLMSSVSGGDFSGTLDLGSCSELSLLANQFNDMNQKLQFLYNEVFQNEIRIKEAEFSALVSQMNPHFLYNTLDTIYWMAKSGNGEAVSDMVTSLSRLMRLSLSGNHGNFVALSTELEQINCYLAIQKIRFQDQITFDLRVEADCMDCRVLKLILQPLVENAIIHGINPVGNGSITIRIYAQGDELIYQVSNTGKLLNVEELKQLLASNTTETRGFALKNISERLRLAVGAKYPLTFGYEDGQTTFWVHQPILPFLAEEDD